MGQTTVDLMTLYMCHIKDQFQLGVIFHLNVEVL